MSTVADDETFLQAFESCTLENFHHRDHVRIGWLYLRAHPLLEAIGKFKTGLQRFAASKGKSEIYHETITWTFLLIIHDRLVRAAERGSDVSSWDAFAAANTDLMTWAPSILERYYTKETLTSPLARRLFVFPDRIG